MPTQLDANAMGVVELAFLEQLCGAALQNIRVVNAWCWSTPHHTKSIRRVALSCS
jgi:hypothetical protein